MIKCIRCNSLNLIFKSEHDFHDILRCSDCLYLQPIRIEDCCKKSNLIVTIEHLDHTRKRLHRQCLNCGGCTDRNKPLSLKKYSEEIRSEFSYHNFEKWKEERGRESIHLWEGVKKLNFDTSKFGKYSNYLNSHSWKLKRTEALFRDNNLCQVCKISAAEEVHHLTYENLFDEKVEDLLSVCKVCHDRLHNKS